MATFVIVHGAWSGAHAWRKVRPLLRAAGHDVFTPALTGLGERAHLASPQVDLETHIRGGVVITGATDRVPARVAQLVYLDAEVPADGESEYDLLAPEERATYEELARARGDGWRIPPP